MTQLIELDDRLPIFGSLFYVFKGQNSPIFDSPVRILKEMLDFEYRFQFHGVDEDD